MHWAAKYIGKPWELGASGPHSFDCWGLVRHVQKEHYGIDLPVLSVGRNENEEVIREIVRHSSWYRTYDATRDGDVLLMTSADGPHVGVALEIDGLIGCLHSIGSKSVRGSVVYTSRVEDLAMLGFARIQVWRHSK